MGKILPTPTTIGLFQWKSGQNGPLFSGQNVPHLLRPHPLFRNDQTLESTAAGEVVKIPKNLSFFCFSDPETHCPKDMRALRAHIHQLKPGRRYRPAGDHALL